jgi:hypothetical protein
MDPQRRPAWSPFFNVECAVVVHSQLTLCRSMFTAMIRTLVFWFLAWLSASAAQADDTSFVGLYKKEAWCYVQRGYGSTQSEKWVQCKK